MIYSSVNDNWARVSIMHRVALDYYNSTKDSDFRKRSENNGAVFPFDTVAFGDMQNERHLVGMVMAWSVITLESMVNHTLAETFSDRDEIISMIEFPRRYADSKNIKDLGNSELAKKIGILFNGRIPGRGVGNLADKISEARNIIVHDKPFEMIDHGDGDIEIDYLRKRGNKVLESIDFNSLPPFYRDCDAIVECLLTVWGAASFERKKMSFSSLPTK